MTTWLIQPVKIEKEKMDYLMNLLERVGIDYEIVYPLNGKILYADKTEFVFKDKTQYVVCGSYPLTRLVYEKCPSAVFSLENYSFEKLWSIFGKENFVNDDALSCHTTQIDWNKQEEYFVRPLEDTKSFNGGIYNKNTLVFEGDVIISSLKHIAREYRFFIINNEIITASLYKTNGSLDESSVIDIQATEFVQKMMTQFAHPGFVIDVALTDKGYKIMELNCLNAAGFYQIDIGKLVMAIEDYYSLNRTTSKN